MNMFNRESFTPPASRVIRLNNHDKWWGGPYAPAFAFLENIVRIIE